jgi:hypothetical protein
VKQIDECTSVDTKIIGMKFAVDAFLQGAFNVDLNEEFGSLKDFKSHPYVKHFMKMVNPEGAALLLPILVPGLGKFLDEIDIPIWAKESMHWFRDLCKALMKQNDSKTGRAKNFLNIFAENRISDEEGKTLTKVRKIIFRKLIQNFVFSIFLRTTQKLNHK